MRLIILKYPPPASFLNLTKAKSGSKVAYRICDTKIEDGFNFARQIGINSTPAIIFENGMLVPGYQDPDKLSEMLSNM